MRRVARDRGLLARLGEINRRTYGRRPQPAPVQRDKVGPREYFSEVKGELRKVAWPTRKEVVNSTIIVLIAVVVMTALILGFDYVSSKFVLFLFD